MQSSVMLQDKKSDPNDTQNDFILDTDMCQNDADLAYPYDQVPSPMSMRIQMYQRNQNQISQFLDILEGVQPNRSSYNKVNFGNYSPTQNKSQNPVVELPHADLSLATSALNVENSETQDPESLLALERRKEKEEKEIWGKYRVLKKMAQKKNVDLDQKYFKFNSIVSDIMKEKHSPKPLRSKRNQSQGNPNP